MSARSQRLVFGVYYLRKWHNGDDDDDEVITTLHCICTPVVLYENFRPLFRPLRSLEVTCSPQPVWRLSLEVFQ